MEEITFYSKSDHHWIEEVSDEPGFESTVISITNSRKYQCFKAVVRHDNFYEVVARNEDIQNCTVCGKERSLYMAKRLQNSPSLWVGYPNIPVYIPPQELRKWDTQLVLPAKPDVDLHQILKESTAIFIEFNEFRPEIV